MCVWLLAIADPAAAAAIVANTATAAGGLPLLLCWWSLAAADGLSLLPAALVVPSFFQPRPVSDKKKVRDT